MNLDESIKIQSEYQSQFPYKTSEDASGLLSMERTNAISQCAAIPISIGELVENMTKMINLMKGEKDE